MAESDGNKLRELLIEAKGKLRLREQREQLQEQHEDEIVALTRYSEKISMRIPRPILALLKEEAKRRGVPYQTFMNMVLGQHATGVPACVVSQRAGYFRQNRGLRCPSLKILGEVSDRFLYFNSVTAIL